MCCTRKQYLLFFVILRVVSITRGHDHFLSCGQRKIESIYFTRNGIDAEAGYWPWHAAIYYHDEARIQYACGGSIIDERTILTASHCVYTSNGVLPAANVAVHVGQIHVKQTNEHTKVHRVENIIVHPGFSTDNIINDIALIKLSTAITMNRYVQPICLWTADSKQDTVVGRSGTIVGFGLTDEGVASVRLKQASVYVVDTYTCKKNDRGILGTHLTMDIFCGKGQTGTGACYADRGGGMFFKVGSRWYVRGLISFPQLNAVTKQCDPLQYTAFTDVTKYLDWIKQYIDQRVLAYDTLGIDYEEKLRLFNFQNCGAKPLASNYQEKIRKLSWLGSITALNRTDSRCTVTLVSEWYAVGPAHCFANEAVEYIVTLDSGYEDSTSGCDGSTLCTHSPQTRRIQNLIVHPEFNKQNYANNIALIELLTPVDTNLQNVQPICLPVTPELRTNAVRNLEVTIFSTLHNSFKNIPVRYVEPAECQRQYSRGKDAMNLQSSTLCAEAIIKQDDTNCRALKAGAPLQETKIIYGTERYFLRGFEMFARTCSSQPPSIYLNVEDYMDWILYNMRYKGQKTTDGLRISTSDQTLESEWSELLQQPGKQKLDLFNMDTCGIPYEYVAGEIEAPWIGYLKTGKHVNDSLVTERNLVVLISEWYALTANRIEQKDVVWRSLVFGFQLPKVCIKCDTFSLDMDIKRIIVPPPEHPRQAFALIELLDSSWAKVPYIRPICLPFMQQLHQRKPTHVIMSSITSDGDGIKSKKLAVIDRHNCLQRLQLEGHSVTLEENSPCAIETERLKLLPLSSRLGTPYQMPVQFRGRTHFFLHGMDAGGSLNFPDLSYGPYLFSKIELADLEWIVGNMEENRKSTPFPSFIPLPSSKKALFNFNNCGQPSEGYAEPWMGKAGKCVVILISEWYAIGSANCLNHTRPQFAEFGDTCVRQDPRFPVCKPNIQKKITLKIFIHPQYKKNSHANDIALLQLVKPVDTSHPGVAPICLPFIDVIDNNDTLSQAMFSDNLITRHSDKYVNQRECQKRWQGLKTTFAIDTSNICLIKERSLEGFCKIRGDGAPLYSRLWINSRPKLFVRGFVVREPDSCSTYYPEIFTSTDAHLDWIIQKMEQPKQDPGILEYIKEGEKYFKVFPNGTMHDLLSDLTVIEGPLLKWD